VPLRHVRQDHRVAHVETTHDLDRVDRAAAHLHLYTRGVMTVLRDLEHPDRAVRLAVRGPARIENPLEPLDLDRPIHAQVGPRPPARAAPAARSAGTPPRRAAGPPASAGPRAGSRSSRSSAPGAVARRCSAFRAPPLYPWPGPPRCATCRRARRATPPPRPLA